MRAHAGTASHAGHAHVLARDTLRLGFLLTLLILGVEAAGGFAAHSLALLSDAGHMLTDVGALGLAWFAAVQAERPANERRTFGYHRVGILTALANGLTLVAVSGGIVYEALHRFARPEPVRPAIMIVTAGFAIAVNLYIGIGLSRAGHGNLNMRAAALHIFGDVAASAGVILGALVIALTGAAWVDPLVSLLIAALIVAGSIRLIGEASSILLESAPRGLSLPSLIRDMLRVPGVHDVHDLHVWTITSGVLALSCHAVIDDVPPSDSAPILDRITAMLRAAYGIGHTTIQFESTAHSSHEGYCACPPDCGDRLYCELRLPEHSRQQEHAH